MTGHGVNGSDSLALLVGKDEPSAWDNFQDMFIRVHVFSRTGQCAMGRVGQGLAGECLNFTREWAV